MNWYTLRVISGKEKKIRESILFDVETANLQDHIENILVPTENVLEMRDGKKKRLRKRFFSLDIY
jgi:transcriptional antiterminator NusG